MLPWLQLEQDGNSPDPPMMHERVITMSQPKMLKKDADELKTKVNNMIRKSVEFAFANPESSAAFVEKHAQEMSKEVRNKHINLYVNKYSVDLGEKGRAAQIRRYIAKVRKEKEGQA